MESNGKYVRAPKAPESEWEIESIGHSDQVLLENSSSFCSATSLDDCDVDEGSERSFDSALPANIAGYKDHEDSDAIPSKNVPIEPDQTHQSTRSRLQRMENVLCDLSKAMASIQRAEPEPFEPDQDWSTPTNSASVTTSSSLHRVHRKPTIAESIKNRARPFDKVDRPEAKRFRGNRYAEQRYSQEPSRRFRCRRCHGHSHSNLPCPALNRNCNICGERGHFAAACRRARVRQLQIKSSPSPTRDSRANETQYVNTLSLADVMVKCSIGSSSPILLLIDSGADVNVIGGKDWCRLKQEYESGLVNLNVIEQSNSKGICAYGTRTPMIVEASFEAQVVCNRLRNVFHKGCVSRRTQRI
nr:uncharacterized protein LOC115267464 [Aedes albopictus]